MPACRDERPCATSPRNNRASLAWAALACRGTGDVSIHEDHSHVSYGTLLQLLGGYLLERMALSAPGSEQHRLRCAPAVRLPARAASSAPPSHALRR